MRTGYRGFTLLEILIAIVLMIFSMSAIGMAAVVCARQARAFRSRSDANLQINYALEDIRLRLVSAVSVDPDTQRNALFGGNPIPTFCVMGEKNMYDIDPNNTATKTRYCYGLRKDLLGGDDDDITQEDLLRSSDGGSEVLIEGALRPQISFSHKPGDPPNMLTVTLGTEPAFTPAGLSKEIRKVQGVRFWFINII
ncbi:MAG: hypothetical protein GX606_02295 [Elusimicrobia bacterium]|nr:hypothetical protein [Elusimicrobiota bacterium]